MEFIYKSSEVKNRSTYNEYFTNHLNCIDEMNKYFMDCKKRGEFDSFQKKHKECPIFESDRITEKRFCHCLAHIKNCNHYDSCILRKNPNRFLLDGGIENADVVDFEVPVTPLKGIGEIDLIIDFDNKRYCTEFKPIWNIESILRMVLEIETYYSFVKDNEAFLDKYHSTNKAILFVKDSLQHKEWIGIVDGKTYEYKVCNELKEAISRNNITVLMLDENKIIKLN